MRIPESAVIGVIPEHLVAHEDTEDTNEVEAIDGEKGDDGQARAYKRWIPNRHPLVAATGTSHRLCATNQQEQNDDEYLHNPDERPTDSTSRKLAHSEPILTQAPRIARSAAQRGSGVPAQKKPSWIPNHVAIIEIA